MGNALGKRAFDHALTHALVRDESNVFMALILEDVGVKLLHDRLGSLNRLHTVVGDGVVDEDAADVVLGIAHESDLDYCVDDFAVLACIAAPCAAFSVARSALNVHRCVVGCVLCMSQWRACLLVQR